MHDILNFYVSTRAILVFLFIKISWKTYYNIAPALQVDFVRSVMAGDHLREEEHMALETLLANVPQNQTVKSNSLEPTPSNTPQLSPATTPANKKNRLPIGTGKCCQPSLFVFCINVLCIWTSSNFLRWGWKHVLLLRIMALQSYKRKVHTEL